MKNQHEFGDLKNFLSGYFHEDWTLEASEPDDVIQNFIRDGASEEEVKRIVRQIEMYLKSKEVTGISEDDLLRELGCYYAPSADGLSARDWLIHLANVIWC